MLTGFRVPLLAIGLAATVVTAVPVAQGPRDFTMALTGDAITTRKLSVYTEPAFLKAIETIRGADVAFTDLEMPITLGHGQARSVRGRPRMAEGPLAAKILGDVERLSAPFGTRMTVRNGIGYVDLTPAAR